MKRTAYAVAASAAFLWACGNGINRSAPQDGKWTAHSHAPAKSGALTIINPCPPGYTNDPDQGCIDLSTDPNNCGAVGNVCDVSVDPCYRGQCVAECPNDDKNPNTNIQDCDGACIDTEKDFYNCGACGNACDDGQVCAGGECDTKCDPSQCDDPPAHSTTVCRPDNSCGFTCNEGYKRSADGKSCIQICDPRLCKPREHAVNFCISDTNSCGFVCVGKSHVNRTGTGCDCDEGYKDDGKGACILIPPVCNPLTCPPVANAQPTCTEGGTCSFTCLPSYRKNGAGTGCVRACLPPFVENGDKCCFLGICL